MDTKARNMQDLFNSLDRYFVLADASLKGEEGVIFLAPLFSNGSQARRSAAYLRGLLIQQFARI